MYLPAIIIAFIFIFYDATTQIDLGKQGKDIFYKVYCDFAPLGSSLQGLLSLLTIRDP